MLITQTGKESLPVKNFQIGHTVVGLTAVKLTTMNYGFKSGVILRTPGPSDGTPNTDTVWIGKSNVTADSDPVTGGFPLLPGAAIELPIEDSSEIYLISTAAAQEVSWLGV